MIRLKRFPALETELDRRAQLLLRDWQAEGKGRAKTLNDVVGQRPSGMPLVAYLRFRILHRQFIGNKTPGFRSLVRMARYVYRNAPFAARLKR